jgi:predicted Zn-dependent protease
VKVLNNRAEYCETGKCKVYLQPEKVGHVAEEHVGNVTQTIVVQTPEKEKIDYMSLQRQWNIC